MLFHPQMAWTELGMVGSSRQQLLVRLVSIVWARMLLCRANFEYSQDKPHMYPLLLVFLDRGKHLVGRV